MENKINDFKKIVIETLKQNDETIKLEDLKGQTAIFIIDMTNGFCKKGNLASPIINAIIPAIKNLVQKSITNKKAIFAINDSHNKDNPEFNSYAIHCLKNTKESQLVTELQFPEIKIIKKNNTNSFLVLKQLKTKGIWDNIIITGCCTDICISQFAVTYKAWFNQQNKNVNIIIPKTMTTTFDSPNHPSAINNALGWYFMIQNGIIVLNTIE